MKSELQQVQDEVMGTTEIDYVLLAQLEQELLQIRRDKYGLYEERKVYKYVPPKAYVMTPEEAAAAIERHKKEQEAKEKLLTCEGYKLRGNRRCPYKATRIGRTNEYDGFCTDCRLRKKRYEQKA